MFPALKAGDVVLADTRFYLRYKAFHRDDIILFEREEQYYVKRVFASSGNHVICNLNYLQLDAKTTSIPCSQSYNKIIGRDEVFVVGDNEEHSLDSRQYGAILKKNIVGKLTFTLGNIR